MTLHGRYTATAVSAGRTDPRDIMLRTVDMFARTDSPMSSRSAPATV
jgi:hypothetical protein